MPESGPAACRSIGGCFAAKFARKAGDLGPGALVEPQDGRHQRLAGAVDQGEGFPLMRDAQRSDARCVDWAGDLLQRGYQRGPPILGVLFEVPGCGLESG